MSEFVYLERCRDYGELHGVVDGCSCDGAKGFELVPALALVHGVCSTCGHGVDHHDTHDRVCLWTGCDCDDFCLSENAA